MLKLPQKKFILDGLLSGIGSAIGAIVDSNTDKDIAEDNLDYQRERNEIEDARYEDETAYNRAFAENERDYQRAFAEDERSYQRNFAENQREYERALQQKIFDREDTAIERQANQLSKLGINPLAKQLNGLGAGQAVSAGASPASTTVGSASAGASSSRGGNALHNSYRFSETFSNLMTPILSFANSLNNLQTGGFQRDKLREEADYQRLKNQEQEIINNRLADKLDKEQEQREEDLRHSKSNNPNIEKDMKSTAERNERENVFQQEYGAYDNSPKEMRWATETAAQADRASKYVNDKIGDLSKSATSVIASQTKRAFNAYNNAMKKAGSWISNKWTETKNWFKKNSASPDYMRDMYGF